MLDVKMARQLSRIMKAGFRVQHYASLWGSHVFEDWSEFFLRRYVLQRGAYPYTCRIRTPTGIVALTLHCPEDSFTVQEIFGLQCYRADQEKVFVDFGSNIGISAAYFLSRNTNSYVYCFEPLGENVQKLKANLVPFSGRFSLQDIAVADFDGEISFRAEPTGRYSGIDNQEGEWRTVQCVSADRILREVIRRHERIDFLKVDVEGAERMFMPKLLDDVLGAIEVICVEGGDVLSSPKFARAKSISGVWRYTRLRRGDIALH